MLPQVEHLELEPGREGALLTLWFNQPATRNALSTEVSRDLLAVLEALPTTPGVRWVVLRGRGGTFCSGGDLRQMRSVFQGGASREQVVAMNAEFGELLRAVRALPQLFIVAIEGAAMAGGLGLACVADVVLATAQARFALSEVTLGIPPAQIAPLVIERLGLSEARRLLLTGERLDGTEALRLGLVHQLAEDAAGLEHALDRLLAQAAATAPGAVGLTKQIIAATQQLRDEALVQFAAERFADALLGEEARAGLRAFADKAPPPWAPATGSRN